MSVNLLIFSSSDIQQRKEQPAKLAEALALMLEYAVHDLISLTKRSLTIAQESKSGALILLTFVFGFVFPICCKSGCFLVCSTFLAIQTLRLILICDVNLLRSTRYDRKISVDAMSIWK